MIQQEGTVQALVALIDLAERAELLQALAVGGFEQRPAGVLDPPAGGGVRALVGVPFVAADPVDGVGPDPHEEPHAGGPLDRLAVEEDLDPPEP